MSYPATRRPVAHLHRIGSRPDVAPTTGRLNVYGADGAKRGTLMTLELPWRANARRVSCIPPGVYRLAPRTSPRFGAHLDVAGEESDGRGDVLIHAGNRVSDTQGCILPGLDWLRDGPRVVGVSDSRAALAQLRGWIGGSGWLVVTADTAHG